MLSCDSAFAKNQPQRATMCPIFAPHQRIRYPIHDGFHLDFATTTEKLICPDCTAKPLDLGQKPPLVPGTTSAGTNSLYQNPVLQ